MGTSHSTAQLVGKITKAQKQLAAKPLNAAAMRDIGNSLSPLAHRAATTTPLGADGAFTRGSKKAASPWFNEPLQARASVHRDGYGVTIGRTKMSAGPWRVAEEGRRQHVAGARYEAGFVKKTGRTKYKRSKANLGAHGGYEAWTKAEAMISAAAPPRVRLHFTKAVMGVFR